jgi:hypothetical protein
MDLLAPGFVALVTVLALAHRGHASRGATVDEIASARLIAAARLRQFEEERAERFRRYHTAWAKVRRSPGDGGRGYLVPFAAADGRR